MAIGVTYDGATMLFGTITVSKGIIPSCAVVCSLPSNLPPVNISTLRFEDGSGNSTNFPDCLPLTPFLRRKFPSDEPLAWRWDVTILDHRWRWQYGSISGKWNDRLPDGTVVPAKKKEPSELATLLLNAMGETGYDVSKMPTGIYPLINWNNINPAVALWDLCEKCACDITGGEVAKVVIYPRGQGNDLPAGGNRLHQNFRFTLASRPRRIVVKGGPTVWQTRLALANVGRETDGTLKLVNNLSYVPTLWSTESPFSFATLSSDSFTDAMESVWRWFRVSGQADGTLAVPGCTEAIADVTQYFPIKGVLLDAGNDLDGVKRPLPAYASGTYWPYSSGGTTLTSSSRLYAPWKLRGDEGIVETQYPCFGLTSAGAIQGPTLYLDATHNVRTTTGDYVSLERYQTLGGSGADLVLKIPELFGSIKVNWSGNPPSQSGTTDTSTTANTEADKYLNAFAAAYPSDMAMDDQEYAGVANISPDGKVAQVRFSGGYNRPFSTRASTWLEFDANTISQAERRRRALIEKGAA